MLQQTMYFGLLRKRWDLLLDFRVKKPKLLVLREEPAEECVDILFFAKSGKCCDNITGAAVTRRTGVECSRGH